MIDVWICENIRLYVINLYVTGHLDIIHKSYFHKSTHNSLNESQG